MKLISIAMITVLVFGAVIITPGIVAADDDNKKENETQFTIYIAFGGACAGFIWFISYASGLAPEEMLERPALLNYGPKGWQAGIPMMHPVKNGAEQNDQYIELLTVRF